MKLYLKVFAILILVSSAVIYSSVFRISKNFNVVDEGKLYRSAQLSQEELEDLIRENKIKTVLSLRGNPPGLFGHEPEAETLERNQIEYYSFALDMDSFPARSDLLEILRILHDAPKPILVHCRSGSDRTGLVSALYQMEEMHKSKEEALLQLSFKYWHVRALHPAMADFVQVYQNREWLENKYRPCSYIQFSEHATGCFKARGLTASP